MLFQASVPFETLPVSLESCTVWIFSSFEDFFFGKSQHFYCSNRSSCQLYTPLFDQEFVKLEDVALFSFVLENSCHPPPHHGPALRLCCIPGFPGASACQPPPSAVLTPSQTHGWGSQFRSLCASRCSFLFGLSCSLLAFCPPGSSAAVFPRVWSPCSRGCLVSAARRVGFLICLLVRCPDAAPEKPGMWLT